MRVLEQRLLIRLWGVQCTAWSGPPTAVPVAMRRLISLENSVTIDQVLFSQSIGRAILLDLTGEGGGETIAACDLERLRLDP